jgi:hypothetical protein
MADVHKLEELCRELFDEFLAAVSVYLCRNSKF